MPQNKSIALKLKNNSTVPLPIAILDGKTTPETNTNDKVLVSWDISGETFSVGNITLNTTTPITRELLVPNIKGVVDALNTMGVGFFTYVGDIIYATYLTDNSVETASLQIGDFTFFVGTGFNNGVRDIILLPTGGFWVVGDFTTYNSLANNRIITLQSNGIADTTFTSGINGVVETVSRQSDGKVIVMGTFTSVQGFAVNNIARLSPSGYDPTFLQGTGFPFGSLVSAIQSDDKIICGGVFPSYNGNISKSLARLNADGTFDPTFAVGTGATGSGFVNSIAIQSDGKIIIAGNISSYNGNAIGGIARVNTDGSFDPTFLQGTGFVGSPRRVKILSDGKIMVVGDISSYDGNALSGVARLNADGTFDATFVSEFPVLTNLQDFAEQSDGKYVFVGFFSGYGVDSAENIVRTTNTGAYDPTLIQGTGFLGTPRKVVLQPDQKIIIVGDFTAYNGVLYNRIIRLLPNGDSDTESTPIT